MPNGLVVVRVCSGGPSLPISQTEQTKPPSVSSIVKITRGTAAAVRLVTVRALNRYCLRICSSFTGNLLDDVQAAHGGRVALPQVMPRIDNVALGHADLGAALEAFEEPVRGGAAGVGLEPEPDERALVGLDRQERGAVGKERLLDAVQRAALEDDGHRVVAVGSEHRCQGRCGHGKDSSQLRIRSRRSVASSVPRAYSLRSGSGLNRRANRSASSTS